MTTSNEGAGSLTELSDPAEPAGFGPGTGTIYDLAVTQVKGRIAMETLVKQWEAGGTSLGAWLSIANSVTAEAVARCNFDYVCTDLQHGVSDYSDAVSMMQATVLGGGIPIARVPWNEPGIIGRMLDAGAHGVIVPMVNTRAEAEAVVRSCRYAPEGSRSMGPIVSGMRDPSYLAWARENTAAIPMIETVEAIKNLDEILSVPGISAIYVGPSDLSISLGLPPANNDDIPSFTEALTTIVAACNRHGVVAGIHSTGAVAPLRIEQGFRMITVSGDMLAMRTAMAAELKGVRTGAASTADKKQSGY